MKASVILSLLVILLSAEMVPALDMSSALDMAKEVLQMVLGIWNDCKEKNKVSYAQLFKAIISDRCDKNAKCFCACCMESAMLMDGDGKVSTWAVDMAAEFIPIEFVKKILKSFVSTCKGPGSASKDKCENAHKFLRCCVTKGPGIVISEVAKGVRTSGQ